MRRSTVAMMTSAIALLLVSAAGLSQVAKPPEPPPLAKVNFPKYETRTLANGLTVYAIQHSEQPIISARLLIKAGSVNDPANLPGVASFTAALLDKGTKTKSATAIAEASDTIGATVGASGDMESTIISGSMLKEHANTVFELMTDILLSPQFAGDELDRMKQQAISSLSADMEDPEFIVDAAFQLALYGSHPYGHPGGGTLDSIPKIERQDLVKFHDAYYVPNNSALIIVGDLPASDAFRMAEKYFGPWKKQAAPASTPPAPSRPGGRRIVVIDKPDAVQTEIRIGQLTVARKDPDYFATLITSYILGGSGSGKLHRKLREERGLTYGAYAAIEPRIGPGAFYAITDTRTEKTVEAVTLILDEIRGMQAKEVKPEELNDAKNYIIGSFPLSIELPSNLSTRLSTVFLYDLGPAYLSTYRDRLAAVTAADVLRIAKTKLFPEEMVVVLSGNASAFKDALQTFGKVEVIPIDKVDLGSAALAAK